MDKLGEGQEVVAADLAQNRDPSFIGFTHQMFLEVAYCSLLLVAAKTAPYPSHHMLHGDFAEHHSCNIGSPCSALQL